MWAVFSESYKTSFLVRSLRIYWTLKLFHVEFSVEAISNAGATLSSNEDA